MREFRAVPGKVVFLRIVFHETTVVTRDSGTPKPPSGRPPQRTLTIVAIESLLVLAGDHFALAPRVA